MVCIGLSRGILAGLAVLLIAMGSADLHARQLTVAAASDLEFAMQDLAAQFEKQTGTRISVTYGSSGNFFSQIQNGAPFDLFFSADIGYAQKLEVSGLAEPGTLYPYAVGRMVIWTPANVPVDLAKQGWSSLLDPAIQKISIANPQHAPYGRAAVVALRRAGLYEKIRAKLVYGENITQAAQFVQSGNAQAGIIALSLAISPPLKGAGKYWLVPEASHPPLEQAAVLLKSAGQKQAARLFLEFVRSPAGRAVLEKYGFLVPREPAPPARNP